MRWINSVGIVGLALWLAVPVEGRETSSGGIGAKTREAYQRLDAGDVDGAKSLFIDVVQVQGGDQDALEGLATCLYMSGDDARAKRTLNIVLQRNEASAYAHALMGNILFREKDYAGAEAALRRAIQEEPRRASFRNNLGVLLREKGDAEGARTAFEEALEQDSRHAEANYNLAALLASGDQPDLRQARRYYKAALKAGFPNNPELDAALVE